MDPRIAQSSKECSSLIKEFCARQHADIERLAGRLTNLFTDGGQLLTAGVGIFHPVAQLVATAFAYRLDFERPALPAICLGSDSVLAAAMASAGQYEHLYVRHLRALNGDNQLLLLCADGTPNVSLQRLRDEMLELGQGVVLLSGAGQRDPLYCDELEDCLDLGTESRARQVELMQFVGHLLCELVEAELFQC